MNHHALSYGSDEQLTADDLRAYRAGQLRGAALHRVERLLLENPFYADALDGLDALQQVGTNLHLQTRDLHLALQERVGETATVRRLMPLWVTSAVASIVLVICVALYYVFYATPGANVPAAADGIEPGTVLIESKSLGLNEPGPKPDAAVRAAPARLATRWTSGRKPVRNGQAQRTQPTAPAVAGDHPPVAEPTTEDHDIMPLPISRADVQRRQTVDTERAFLQ